MGEYTKSEQGFTLIEVLMAMLVLTILIGTSLSVVVVANQYNAQAQTISIANDLALGKMQDYELMDFEDIPVGSAGNDYEVEDFSANVPNLTDKIFESVSAKVFVEPISGSLKKITVDFEYVSNRDERQIIYATYVQVDGVGR